MKKIASICAVLAAMLTLSACNTIQGVDQDVRATGNAIERAAQ